MAMDDPADGAWGPGVGGASDEMHKRMCMSKVCTRCYWIDNGAKLKEKVGDWVDFKLDFSARHAGIGCAWCAIAKDDPNMIRLGLFKANNLKFATYQMEHTRSNPMKLKCFQRHCQCPGHSSCVAIMTEAEVQSDGTPGFGDWSKVEACTLSGSPTSIEGEALMWAGTSFETCNGVSRKLRELGIESNFNQPHAFRSCKTRERLGS